MGPDMEYSNINISFDFGIAWLTINRPEVRNALDLPTWKEIHRFIEESNRDEAVQVLVITGAGDEAFAAGSDLYYLRERSMLATLEGYSQRVLLLLEEYPKPTIAAVNGYAIGGGCELAMACDIRVASDRAKFGQPEVGLGILPGAGGTQRLTRLVGVAKAKELIFTAEIIDAHQAEKIGLVNHVVPHLELAEYVKKLANRILTKGPLAVRLAKQAINAGVNEGPSAGYAAERLAQAVLFGTDDHLEGIDAAIEKRRPNFKGE
jgi:enoyl-CoA hydratase